MVFAATISAESLGSGSLLDSDYLCFHDSCRRCSCRIPAAAATPAPIAPETKAVAVDRQMLEETVNKALERQLAPVKEMLTELTIHRTSLTDIIGGIGYILGLFGLWAYFLSKRKKNS